MDRSPDDCARDERQDETLAESEAIKARLLAHTVQLELFIATLRRTQNGDDGNDGRVD